MKIIPTSPVTGIEQYGKIKQKTNVGQTQSIQKDEINFSSDATLFADALKVAKQDMGARLNQSNINVGEIKSQIENGTYEVDSNELADSILMLQGYYERR